MGSRDQSYSVVSSAFMKWNELIVGEQLNLDGCKIDMSIAEGVVISL